MSSDEGYVTPSHKILHIGSGKGAAAKKAKKVRKVRKVRITVPKPEKRKFKKLTPRLQKRNIFEDIGITKQYAPRKPSVRKTTPRNTSEIEFRKLIQDSIMKANIGETSMSNPDIGQNLGAVPVVPAQFASTTPWAQQLNPRLPATWGVNANQLPGQAATHPTSVSPGVLMPGTSHMSQGPMTTRREVKPSRYTVMSSGLQDAIATSSDKAWLNAQTDSQLQRELERLETATTSFHADDKDAMLKKLRDAVAARKAKQAEELKQSFETGDLERAKEIGEHVAEVEAARSGKEPSPVPEPTEAELEGAIDIGDEPDKLDKRAVTEIYNLLRSSGKIHGDIESAIGKMMKAILRAYGYETEASALDDKTLKVHIKRHWEEIRGDILAAGRVHGSGTFLQYFLHEGMPRPVANFLETYGDGTVESVAVGRTVLPAFIKSAANVVSIGQFEKNLEKHNIDDLFHTFMIIHIKNPSTGQIAPIYYEKNERVSIGIIDDSFYVYKRPYELVDAAKPTPVTLNQFIANGAKSGGDHHWIYNVRTANCQTFVMDNLRGNGLVTPALSAFVQQPIDEIVPGYMEALTTGLTDAAAVMSQYKHGGAPILYSNMGSEFANYGGSQYPTIGTEQMGQLLTGSERALTNLMNGSGMIGPVIGMASTLWKALTGGMMEDDDITGWEWLDEGETRRDAKKAERAKSKELQKELSNPIKPWDALYDKALRTFDTRQMSIVDDATKRGKGRSMVLPPAMWAKFHEELNRPMVNY